MVLGLLAGLHIAQVDTCHYMTSTSFWQALGESRSQGSLPEITIYHLEGSTVVWERNLSEVRAAQGFIDFTRTNSSAS